MQIPGILASDPLTGAKGPSESQLGKDSFMRLLVNQLKNQHRLRTRRCWPSWRSSPRWSR